MTHEELTAALAAAESRALRAEQALRACWLEMQWAGAHLDVMPDDYADAMREAGKLSGASSPDARTTNEPKGDDRE